MSNVTQTTKSVKMSAARSVNRAIRAEMSMRAPDGRRMVRTERMRVQTAVQHGDATQAMVDELDRVVAMWSEVSR